jgi:hypothetical protein
VKNEDAMTDPIMPIEEFENTRVARFKDLKSSTLPLLDAVIPGCEREIYNIIGRGVSEDRNHHVPITYNLGGWRL